MIIADFKEENTIQIYGMWQWDYGQVLRIQGINLPTAVEIQFSLRDKGGYSISRVGTTKEGVTDVTIPDSMLENNGIAEDYMVYAFVYITDETSGQTEYKISIRVKSRPKPEVVYSPEEVDIFKEAIAEVNDAADRAQTAEKEAEGWAHGREDMPDRAEDNAMYYAGKASENAEKTEQDKEAVEKIANDIDKTIEQKVNDYMKENPVTADIEEVDHGTSDTTFELTPNVKHKWGEVASLTLTLAAGKDGIVNEYMFSFVSGATPTQVSLPAGVEGLPAIEPNSRYEMSIVDDCLAYGRWDYSVEV